MSDLSDSARNLSLIIMLCVSFSFHILHPFHFLLTLALFSRYKCTCIINTAFQRKFGFALFKCQIAIYSLVLFCAQVKQLFGWCIPEFFTSVLLRSDPGYEDLRDVGAIDTRSLNHWQQLMCSSDSRRVHRLFKCDADGGWVSAFEYYLNGFKRILELKRS